MGCGGPDWMECLGYVPPQMVWIAFFGGFVCALIVVFTTRLLMRRKTEPKARGPVQ